MTESLVTSSRASFPGVARQPVVPHAVQPATEPKVTVVIPAKNEADSLPHVLSSLPTGLHQVIVVDGGSTDGTTDVARRFVGVTVIGQTRTGKGNALACGFAVATGDFIVMLDADGSTDPGEIPHFVEALARGVDFAKGSRSLEGGGSSDLSLFRRVGNFGLNKIVNLIYGTRYTDLCYGYNAFRRECLEAIDLEPGEKVGLEADGPDGMRWGDGFEVETLIHIRVAKAGLKVLEVPSFERTRLFGRSNLHAVSDGIRVLRCIRTERKRQQAASNPMGQREQLTAWPLLSNCAEEAS